MNTHQSPADDLAARAERGDAAAQYALAARMHADGRIAEARRWLERAAVGEHPDALFTVSAAGLTGAGGVPLDRLSAVAGLKRAANLGSAPAHRVLAALYAAGIAVDSNWEEACRYLLLAVERSDPVALREAGMALLFADPDDLDGAAMINCAASADGVAGAIAVRRAALNRRGSSTELAKRLLPLLAGARFPSAPQLARRFAEASDIEDRVDAFDIERIAAKLQPDALRAPPKLTQICTRPNIRTLDSAFTPEACDYLMGVAAPRLERAAIVDGRTDETRIDRHRTAWGATFHSGLIDLPLVIIGRRLAQISGVAFENAEPMNVLRYRPGEEYRPHHDFLSESESDLVRRGQRVRTALIYLSEGFEGGETHFLSPDIRYVGKPGDVIVFDNVDAAGAPDVSARHAARPVRMGEKWLASVWFRDRPYVP